MGRPNVGKSALFNRVTGSGLAIVYDYPGVTRDRLYMRAVWGDCEFVVVDTGGLMSEAAKLPSDQQPEAMRSISSAGIPQVGPQHIRPLDRVAKQKHLGDDVNCSSG